VCPGIVQGAGVVILEVGVLVIFSGNQGSGHLFFQPTATLPLKFALGRRGKGVLKYDSHYFVIILLF
jgi:hypothetical protein